MYEEVTPIVVVVAVAAGCGLLIGEIRAARARASGRQVFQMPLLFRVLFLLLMLVYPIGLTTQKVNPALGTTFGAFWIYAAFSFPPTLCVSRQGLEVLPWMGWPLKAFKWNELESASITADGHCLVYDTCGHTVVSFHSQAGYAAFVGRLRQHIRVDSV